GVSILSEMLQGDDGTYALDPEGTAKPEEDAVRTLLEAPAWDGVDGACRLLRCPHDAAQAPKVSDVLRLEHEAGAGPFGSLKPELVVLQVLDPSRRTEKVGDAFAVDEPEVDSMAGFLKAIAGTRVHGLFPHCIAVRTVGCRLCTSARSIPRFSGACKHPGR